MIKSKSASSSAEAIPRVVASTIPVQKRIQAARVTPVASAKAVAFTNLVQNLTPAESPMSELVQNLAGRERPALNQILAHTTIQ